MVAELMDENVALLSVWRNYCDHAQQLKHCVKKNGEKDDATFSFILEFAKKDKLDIYAKCGFSQDEFIKLDILLLNMEQNCLHNIIAEYERFRLLSNASDSSVSQLPESDFKELDITSQCQELYESLPQDKFMDTDKLTCLFKTELDLTSQCQELSEPLPQDNVMDTDKLTCFSKTEKNLSSSAVKEDLGRGKRKKFLKAKFEFLDCGYRNSFKPGEQLEKCSSVNSPGKYVQKLKSRDRSMSKITVASSKRLCEEVNTCEQINNHMGTQCLTEAAARCSGDEVSGIKDVGVINGQLGTDQEKENTILKSQDAVYEICADKSGKGNKITGEDKQFAKKWRNLSFNESKGRVVCCLGERVDARPRDNNKCLSAKDSKQKSSEGSEETNNLNLVKKNPCAASESSLITNENQKLYGDRPPGERFNLDCDKLAPIVCSYCRKTFQSASELSSHWRKEHKQDGQLNRGRIFMCPVCQMTFTAAHCYKLHYRIHSGARPHTCSICSRTFRIFKGLQDHMSVHTEEKQFCCSICKKMFGSYRLLQQHKMRHKDRPKRYTCEFCGKAFQRRPSLMNHLLIHTGEKPHQCSYCGMAFNQKSSLNTHERLHTGVKNHICDICGRRFNTNVAMLTHRRRHTGEKPYKCDQCNYRASSSSCLNDHKSVHRTEKPYACQVANCNRSFKRRSHLISHHKTHVGVKPYKCHKCGACYTLTSDLRRHIRTNSCQDGEIMVEHTSLSSIPLEVNIQNPKTEVKVKSEQRDVEDDIHLSPIDDSLDKTEKILHLETMAQYPENSVVIEIVREPGKENSDLVFSKEELDAIFRFSQQL